MLEELDIAASDDNEVEDDNPNSGVIVEPFDPSIIRISSFTPTIDLLVSRIKEKEIKLDPDFQRNFVWKKDAQSRLIESLLIRIPLPAFYIDATNEEEWLVVDGLQRLSTLQNFIIDGKLELLELEYLKYLNGKTFDELPRNLKRRILETQVVVYKIESGTPDNVKLNIFKRINTGGVPLSLQEIRHALDQHGNSRKLLADLAESPQFKEATNKSIPSKRMEDREFVLRALTFMITPYEKYRAVDWDVFLAEHMKIINRMSASEIIDITKRFYRAMNAASSIFGDKAFRKQYTWSDRKKPINKALFEAWTINLDKLSNTQLEFLKKRKEDVNSKFRQLMGNSEFENAISQGTGDLKKVLRRFGDIEKLINEVLNAPDA